jgi:thioredoxin 1
MLRRGFRIYIGAILLLCAGAGCRSQLDTGIDRAPRSKSKVEPVVVTDATFQMDVLESTQPVLVDFWSARCPPCLEMKPAIRALAADFIGRATIAQLDVDENPATAEEYGVRELPAVLIFQNGKIAKRLTGLQTKEQLAHALSDAWSADPEIDRE